MGMILEKKGKQEIEGKRPSFRKIEVKAAF
jgi:hypothetical protein